MRHRQVEREMRLRLRGDADEVFPLFGPLREREWDPEWRPVFVAPDNGESCANGTIFKVESPNESIWVMTDYDPIRRRVRYVMVQPGLVTSQIEVQVTVDEAMSAAKVTYRRTALTEAGERALDRFLEEWPSWAAQWETAINDLLSRRKSGR